MAETPSEEPKVSEESRPEADQPVAEAEEPTVTPVEPEKGNLSAVILKDTLAASISDISGFDFGYEEAGSATLVTDKPDYAPTDTVLIYGTEFTPNKEYTLEVTSDTGNFKFSDTVTSDESGSLFYSFQLDGTYRPLYKVEAKDGETVIASTTFTDSRTINLVTLNGVSSVTVTSGESIAAVVNATTTSGDDWESTSWRISTSPPGSVTCANTSNETSSGTYNKTFNITANNSRHI